MDFINHSGRELWLGLYDAGERAYTFTLFTLGGRQRILPGGRTAISLRLPERVQIVVWSAGFLGTALRAGRVLSSSHAVSFAEDADGLHIYAGERPPTTQQKIEHVFVLMMENRSFDHLLGWLYEGEGNRPPINIPAGDVPSYDGLTAQMYWNNPNAARHDDAQGRIYAGKVPVGEFTWPNPNPPEICPRFVEGMFGTESPAAGAVPEMTGFIQAYAKVDGGAALPQSIMACYTPAHIPRLSGLAKQYAVCDRWFASIPCMTYPNRSFLHAGTSFGRLNNNNDKYSEGSFPADPVPNVFAFAGQRTVFDEYDDLKVPYDLYTSSEAKLTLLGLQFFTVPQKLARPFKHFREMAQSLRDDGPRPLPQYIFIEPEYAVGANDQHPPLDVRIGDGFIGNVFDVIRNSPLWRKSALIVIFDEHGGCYDHVSPPTALRPDATPQQFPVGDLDPLRVFGPRVPAVVVSPLIKPGTVFRSTGMPHDHTSILSTLREMLFPFGNATPFFASNPRIANAPTIWMLFEDDDRLPPRPADPATLLTVQTLLLD